MSKPKSVVFFARDFLSKEFGLFSNDFVGYKKIFIVVQVSEKKIVQKIAVDSDIYCFDEINTDEIDVFRSRKRDQNFNSIHNLDRFLRFLDDQDINEVEQKILFILDRIFASSDPKFFFDEPVSGFINHYLNTFFRINGVVNCHFQSSWLPDYWYFTSDIAQSEPLTLSAIKNSKDLMLEHLELRKNNQARPNYVLNYDNLLFVVRDIIKTITKILYRIFFKQNSNYLYKSIYPHTFHLRSLIGSIFFNYINLSNIDKDKKYIIFPLHYEPESLISYFSKHIRQQDIANRILDSLPLDYKLILKEHPSQPGALSLPLWQNIIRSKRVIPLSGKVNSKEVFKLKPIILSLGSTMCIEAALEGLKVFVLGKVHFKDMPGIIHIKNPEDWLSYENASLKVDQKDIYDWYEQFLEAYCFKGNFIKDNTFYQKDLAKLVIKNSNQ